MELEENMDEGLILDVILNKELAMIWTRALERNCEETIWNEADARLGRKEETRNINKCNCIIIVYKS